MASHRWFTPNTYDTNFAEPPKSPGVYCIKEYSLKDFKMDKRWKPNIVYVGSSINLFQRFNYHEVLTKLQNENNGNYLYAFYFKPVSIGFYDLEISLIKRLQPRLNKIHK